MKIKVTNRDSAMFIRIWLLSLRMKAKDGNIDKLKNIANVA